jgi:hypothetical protein
VEDEPVEDEPTAEAVAPVEDEPAAEDEPTADPEQEET